MRVLKDPDFDDAYHDGALCDAIETGHKLDDLIDDLRADLAASGLPLLDMIDAAERLAAAYGVNSRTLRRNILTRDHLARRRRNHAAHHAAARRRIIRQVEDAIEATRPAPPENPDAPEATETLEAVERIEALERDLAERLDSPEFAAELAIDTPQAIADAIRHDLGLAPDPHLTRRRTQADIARLHARARHDPNRHDPNRHHSAGPPEHAHPALDPERHHHQAAAPAPAG